MRSPLELLFVSSYPASPPTFGAQRRIDGLMRALAKRNRVSFIGLAPRDFDRAAAERAMREYCREVILIPWPQAEGLSKRVSQALSLASLRSHERRTMNNRRLWTALRGLLRSRAFDLVSLEAPFFAYAPLGCGPRGSPRPRVIIDSHNVEFDLARQYGEMSSGLVRTIHHAANWRKMRRDEVMAWRRVDGVAFTSYEDAARARAILPSLRTAVVPNGVDVDQFRPRLDLPTSDGKTVVFFGTMNYYPNLDAVRWLLQEIWPVLSRRNPDARLKIIGSHPTPDILAQAGPRVEIAGLVDDLQRHLSEAAAILVPLRIGGGTRLKILESLAMSKAIVSTSLGAEGIAARSGEHLIIADDPSELANLTGGILDDPAQAQRLGEAGRALAERSYSWSAIGDDMEKFIIDVLEARTTDRAPDPTSPWI